MKQFRFDSLEVAAVVLAICAFALFVAGFFVPPLGVIDGSVLKAGGELLGFVSIFFAWYAVKHGHSAEITHGKTSAKIKADGNDGATD